MTRFLITIFLSIFLFSMHAQEVLIDGNLILGDNQIKQVADPSDLQDATTKIYVDSENTAQSVDVILSNGNFANNIQLKGLQNPTDSQDASTKDYVDLENLAQSIDVILTNGNNANSQQLKGLADPTDDQDAVNKIFAKTLVDESIKKLRKKANTLLYLSNGF